MEPKIIEFLIAKVAQLTLFALMLHTGLNLTRRQVLYLWYKPGLLIRTVLASFVLVPIAAIIIAQIIPLPVPVRVGIVLMAVTPGAPLIYQKASRMKWNTNLAASYQVTVSLLVILFLPLSVAFLRYLYPNQGSITPLQVFQQVLSVQLIPLAIGLGIRAGIPELADNLARTVIRIGNGLLLALVVVILIKGIDAMLDAGILPILAITLIATVTLGIGHFLGGPDPDTRATLAIANATRNVGLAMVVTVLNFTKAAILPTVIIYALISALAAVVYNKRIKRALKSIHESNH